MSQSTERLEKANSVCIYYPVDVPEYREIRKSQ